jgi:hypothetical protein
MTPYKADCQKEDRIWADLHSYGLGERDVEKSSTLRHDVAGFLLHASEVAEQGTSVGCGAEVDRLQAAAAPLKGIAFAPGAECPFCIEVRLVPENGR